MFIYSFPLAIMNVTHEYLNVTAVHKHGPFLRLCGHRNKDQLMHLDQHIRKCLRLVQRTGISAEQLSPKVLYLATPDSSQFYRCILIKQKTMSSAQMESIDYGIQFEVPFQNVSKRT